MTLQKLNDIWKSFCLLSSRAGLRGIREPVIKPYLLLFRTSDEDLKQLLGIYKNVCIEPNMILSFTSHSLSAEPRRRSIVIGYKSQGITPKHQENVFLNKTNLVIYPKAA